MEHNTKQSKKNKKKKNKCKQNGSSVTTPPADKNNMNCENQTNGAPSVLQKEQESEELKPLIGLKEFPREEVKADKKVEQIPKQSKNSKLKKNKCKQNGSSVTTPPADQNNMNCENQTNGSASNCQQHLMSLQKTVALHLAQVTELNENSADTTSQ